VIGQTAVSSSLVISTWETPGLAKVSRPAKASEPGWPSATNSVEREPESMELVL
jgi:hypothetical protein